jgi:D-sedoheptulose 7-phosphate isomerase
MISRTRSVKTAMSDHVERYVGRLCAALQDLPMENLEELGELLFRAYLNERQVFTIGNGGSASTASHIAADLGKNTIGPNMRRFRIMSLSDNASVLTALSNDIGYEHVFVEQLMNLIRPADVLIAVSASGNSPNILRATEYAQSQSAHVVGLLGFDGGKAARMVDLPILVPVCDYGAVEDVHLVVNHILVDYFRERIAGADPWLMA